MPIIVCPKCKKQYDVPLDVLGKKVTCKKCGNAFEAKVLRQHLRKPDKKNPMVILLSILGVGLFIIIALIVQSSFEDEPVPVQKGEAVEEIEPSAPEVVKEEDAPPEPVRTARERFCLDFIEAVAENDIDTLQKMFNFPVYHRLNRAEGEPHWTDLDEVDRVMRKQEYTDRLTDDSAAGGGFVRNAAVLFTKETSWDGTKGVIEVELEHLNNGRKQLRSFTVQRFGDAFTVIDYEVGPERGGDLDAVDPGMTTLDEKYKKRVNPAGEIAPVEYLPDTDDRTRAELKYLLKALTSEDRNKAWKARGKIEEIGKPAIPGLLNQMVGLEMTRREDVAEANKYVTILRKITGRTFGFDPSFMRDTVLDSQAADLEHSLRRWFGWWERNKDTWTKREDLEEEEEENL
jgi:predicted Zn finger-like uncharacterized protein